jgi:hypothetical protein
MIASFKAVELYKFSKGYIITVRVIKYRIAGITTKIKGFKRFSDDFSYRLTSISASKLR